MNKNKSKNIITIGIIIVIILTILFSIPFINFIEDSNKLRDYIDSFGIFSPLMYILLISIQILIPFIPGEPFELLAGYAFGGVKGSIYCFIGEMIGTIIVIYLVKKHKHKLIEIYFKKESIDKLHFLRSKKSFITYAIIFIIPGTPKDLLCYVGALCDFELIPLLIVATIGRLPAILTSTITSSALGDRNYLFGIVLTLITAFISSIGLLMYNYICKKHQKKEDA